MAWFLVALATAFSEGSKDIFFSQPEMKRVSAIFRAWVISAAALPALAIMLFLTGMPEEIKSSFWWLVAVQAILLSLAQVLYMRALSLGPVSQTQPILALTPVFLIVTTPLMTNDHVTLFGWLGVILVAIGIYASQHPGRDAETGKIAGFFSPFVEAMRQPGVVSKLGVALIFAITANMDRLCMEASSGPFYLTIVSGLVAVILGGVMLSFPRWMKTEGEPPRKSMLLVGGSIHACTILLHVWALTFAAVPYVIAVKRLSIVFVSLWGYLVRKERAPHWFRILGLFVAVGGAVLILILGKQ
jgi:drug/metabolite transporter (DMT)-like permease